MSNAEFYEWIDALTGVLDPDRQYSAHDITVLLERVKQLNGVNLNYGGEIEKRIDVWITWWSLDKVYPNDMRGITETAVGTPAVWNI
jgi:hypothetical protein